MAPHKNPRVHHASGGTVKLKHDLRTAAQFVGFAAARGRNPLWRGQTVFRQLDNTEGRPVDSSSARHLVKSRAHVRHQVLDRQRLVQHAARAEPPRFGRVRTGQERAHHDESHI